MLKVLLLFFSVAAIKTSFLAHISILDRKGGLSGSETWRRGIGDFHRAPLHLWVIMVACEVFFSLSTTYRQNDLNLKCKRRKISPSVFLAFAGAVSRKQVVMWSSRTLFPTLGTSKQI
jgi:hypothetical protein